MKNKSSVIAGTRVAIAASIFAFAWASVSAAEMAGTARPLTEFQAVSNSDLLVLGPVDVVDQSKGRVQVLGQWIPVSANQLSQDLLGHVVAAYGSITPEGSFQVAAVHEQSSIDYVSGETRLYLKGSISDIDALHGTARIGALSVDYSGALHTLVAEDLAVGTVVSFSGLRYTDPSKLFADNGVAHPVAVLGQTGSGFATAGQTGSGFATRGQTGSGFAVAGQTGSGFAAAGQTGSGFATRGQTGSGFAVAGQTGSGFATRGQTGSGFAVAGQTGSGFAAAGQTGSGFATRGQTGSGFAVAGQTGSGFAVAGQTGSGFATRGQTGSGFAVAGQTGSGFAAAGQTGSGFAKIQGQTGSGFAAAGQTGSGFRAAGQTGSGLVKVQGQTGSGL